MQSIKNIVNLLIVLGLVWLSTHQAPTWLKVLAILVAAVMIAYTVVRIVRKFREQKEVQ